MFKYIRNKKNPEEKWLKCIRKMKKYEEMIKIYEEYEKIRGKWLNYKRIY